MTDCNCKYDFLRNHKLQRENRYCIQLRGLVYTSLPCLHTLALPVQYFQEFHLGREEQTIRNPGP